MLVNRIVLDTSVLVDIWLTNRARHSDALRLVRLLSNRGIRVATPAHALFELAAAVRQEHRHGATDQNLHHTAANPLAIDSVVIDDAFFERAYAPDLPYLKGSDMIFMALARVDRLPLITEDEKLLMRSREAGVAAYRISEYLDAFESEPPTT